jgi:hypothetical protein
MKRLWGLLAFLPMAAHATQSSLICKTNDTSEYIDVVSKGENTNDVLVQINGGKYFDGTTMLMNTSLIVTVTFTTGGMILVYDYAGKSSVMMAVDNQKQFHDIVCRFRN